MSRLEVTATLMLDQEELECLATLLGNLTVEQYRILTGYEGNDNPLDRIYTVLKQYGTE